MTPRDSFDRYGAVLQGLTANTLDTLDAVLAPEVHFQDPIHDVTGAPAMKAGSQSSSLSYCSLLKADV